MPFQIIRNDITKIRCDAIINPTDRVFSGSGGLDAAIHRAAGTELRKKCDEIGTCPTGGAVATPAFRLSCSYIIHTVGPTWRGAFSDDRMLSKCYVSSLSLAQELGCETVAVPVVSGGTHRYPEDRALSIAEKSIRDFLIHSNDDLTVFLVVYGSSMTSASRRLFGKIFEFIGDNYTGSERKEPRKPAQFSERQNYLNFLERSEYREDDFPDEDITLSFSAPHELARPEMDAHPNVFSKPGAVYDEVVEVPGAEDDDADFSLQPNAAPPCPNSSPNNASTEFPKHAASPRWEAAPNNLKQKKKKPFVPLSIPHSAGSSAPDFRTVLDESFAQMLFRKIDEKGLKDSECYKRANMSRQAFSKMRCDPNYHPSKPRAYALAVALRLSLDETKELLGKAGYSMSRSVLMDVILEYFICSRSYDIFDINEVLFAYDQQLLS